MSEEWMNNDMAVSYRITGSIVSNGTLRAITDKIINKERIKR